MKRLAFAATLALFCTTCGGGSSEPVGAPGASVPQRSGPGTQIDGAGATFPYPLYSKWFSEYNKLHPEVRINYQSLGSGAGIQQITAQTVFFGATDSPMSDEQLKQAPGTILHFPTALGAVVPVYNVDGLTAPLKFTGPLLADIYMGKVKRWNDPALAKANPGIALPAAEITVVHRSDGSGTTFIFTDYLGKVSPAWQSTVGVKASVNWPVGVGGKGNEGVAGLIKQSPGSIGYVELIYAMQNKISYGSVQNAAGESVTAGANTVTAAAAGALANMPPDFRVSITNAPGSGAYPIASFTWILLYEAPQDARQARVMVEFMKWALSDGQRLSSDLFYAPLPAALVQQEMDQLARIKLQ